MLNSIPEEINNFCTSRLGAVSDFRPASGGCINEAGRLSTDSGDYFVKWNSSTKFPNMFSKEAKGLQLLAEPKCMQIPKVVDVYEGETYSCIIMEQVTPAARSRKYWQELANGLACLHEATHDQFGLDHDNYIGSLPQYNHREDTWTDFFIRWRLQPQVKMAYDSGKLDDTGLNKFRQLESKLPSLLAEGKPSLTHGDLWSGNLMTGERGNPVLVDPAVAYVHREMEIAYTELFGGFDHEFYETYKQIFPFEPGYRDRFDIYNIYPLMVHVNLFGGGYYQQVKYILNKYT